MCTRAHLVPKWHLVIESLETQNLGVDGFLIAPTNRGCQQTRQIPCVDKETSDSIEMAFTISQKHKHTAELIFCVVYGN